MRLANGMEDGYFHRELHSPCGKAVLASETTRANSSVLAGPRVQTFCISRTQSAGELLFALNEEAEFFVGFQLLRPVCF